MLSRDARAKTTTEMGQYVQRDGELRYAVPRSMFNAERMRVTLVALTMSTLVACVVFYACLMSACILPLIIGYMVFYSYTKRFDPVYLY